VNLWRREYHIPCPYSGCGAKLTLHETILEEIILGLAKSTKDVADIGLLCPACKGIFVFERDRLPDILAVPAPAIPQTAPQLFFLGARCDKSNCEVRRIFVAVRPAEDTKEQIAEEWQTWRVDDALCPNYHRLLHAFWFV
jgi:hypothetical protein